MMHFHRPFGVADSIEPRFARISVRTLIALACYAILLAPPLALAEQLAEPSRVRPEAAAIASAHPLATAAGAEILEAGGNAFDAAVAVSAALAVVEPYSSGVGGGGFWLLHRASDGRDLMLDGRERAPLAAHRNLYLDETGRFVPEQALNGPLAAGIPGMPAALVKLSADYGRLSLARSLAPAIALARNGFEVDPVFVRFAKLRGDVLRASPGAAAQFLIDGHAPEVGQRLIQTDLAHTLIRLAEHGHAGFYSGETARLLVDGVRKAGGIWSLEDLATYRALERAPIVAHYKGWRMISASPPSSGGVLLAEMLNMLTSLEDEHPGVFEGDERVHVLAEVMRRAYRDRARYLGDPDQVKMPIERLIHPLYAAGLARDMDLAHASPSLLGDGRCTNETDLGHAREGRDTTHFSILDSEGNRVAATLSINYPFGSGFVAPGTGVLLNDEMDDFSAQPGIPNAYGLIGGEANAIAPGKRMLSSMSPTFLESPQGVAILGTPGGSRIITMVLQGILAAADGRPVEDWVSAPRVHHQYLPDVIQIEPDALSEEAMAHLVSKGHRIEPLSRPFGNMQAIAWSLKTGRVGAASDPRGIGSARVISAGSGMRQIEVPTESSDK